MFGLSGGHLVVLGIVVLLFGSRKLPELGSSLGKGMRAFKNAVEGVPDRDLAEKTVDELDLSKDRK